MTTTSALEHAEADLAWALEAGADAEAIASASARLDALEPAPRTISLATSAAWYAKQGLQVFPLQPRCKLPYARSHGCKDATDDLERIARWWEKAPHANIGIATGHLIDVIDIDGAIGQLSRARNWEMFEALEVLVKVTTPRPGGMHLYVPASGEGNRAGILPGVDYRGDGGYVLAPPSELDDRAGQHAGTYRFLVTAPAQLVARLTELRMETAA